MNYLRKIDPFVFEELLLTHFENKGFKIIRNKKYTGDGGFDGTIFNKNNEKILIQAKRYTNYIHKKDLLNFEQLVIENHCKGFFIHTGKTSKNNLLFADNENISIYSGNKLLDLLN
jgi:restriction system protein